MKVKNIDIIVPKFNYQKITVGIKNGEDYTKLGDEDLIFMTVRHSPEDTEFKFQKSLEDGITYNEETGKYDIEINTEDTQELKYRVDYGYDITIYYEGRKPVQKVVGKFTVSDQFTVSEVGSDE